MLCGRGDPEGCSSGRELLGELVSVGEGVGVGFDPLTTMLLGGFELNSLFVETPEVAMIVTAGSGEPAGTGVLFDLVPSLGEAVELGGAVGWALAEDLGVEVGEAGLEHGEGFRSGEHLA